MARRGVTVDESIECRGIGSGEATDRLLAVAASMGYRAVNVGANRFQFARTYRPTWTIVVSIVLFPIGLLFLLVRSTETWACTVEEDHRRVLVRVGGPVLPDALLQIRAALAAGPAAGTIAPVGGMAVDHVAVPDHRPSAPPAAVHQLVSPPMAAPVSPPIPVPVPTPLQAASPPLAAPPVTGGVSPGGTIGPPPGVPVTSAWAPAATPTFLPDSAPLLAKPTSVPPAQPPVARAPAPAPVPPAGPASSPATAEVPREVVEQARPLTDAIGRSPGSVPPVFDGATTITRSPDDVGRIWLTFDTGEEMEAPAVMLVGRDPAASDSEEESVVLLAITDVDLSVSKTHMVLTADWDGVWVSDRGSTNGTQVEDSGGRVTPVKPGALVKAVAGATVRFGTREMKVAARTAGGS